MSSTACSTPTRADGWAEASRGVGRGLDASLLHLEADLADALPASDSAAEDARRGLQADLRTAYTPVLDGWEAFADFAREAEFALTEDGPLGAARLRDAFHALHVALLESRLADDFGIDPEAHRALLAGIGASGSAATAFALAHPFVEHLADGAQTGALRLVDALEVLAADAQQALRRQAAPLMTARADLRSEEEALADRMRRRAAGLEDPAGPGASDPARALRALREELDALTPQWDAFEERTVALDAAFRAARTDVREAAQGFHAWGALHGRVADALRDGRADVDLTLLREIADSF
jgi:hypothetical protein